MPPVSLKNSDNKVYGFPLFCAIECSYTKPLVRMTELGFCALCNVFMAATEFVNGTTEVMKLTLK